MTSRSTLAIAALAFTALAACDPGSRIPGTGDSGNDVRVRVVNTTTSAIDLTSNGQVVGGSGHVNAGTGSSCISIDPAVTTSVGVLEEGATSDYLVTTPVLMPGARYTVVAYTSDDGTMRAIALPDELSIPSGLAALRIVHVAPGVGSLDVYVTPRNGPLGTPSTASVGYGGNTGYFDVESGASQLRFTIATTPTLAFDAGTITLTPQELATVVLAQPTGPAGALISLLVPSC